MTLVSVVIPTRNRSALVEEAIASVQAQTCQDFEIVVVDDDSQDDTRERLETRRDLRYLRQPRGGQARARNLGVAHSTGAFVCTLDSDDVWEPEFLERSLEAMERLQLDFAFANWIARKSDGTRFDSYFQTYYPWWSYPRSEEVAGWRLLVGQDARDLLVRACVSPSSALMLRRSSLPGPTPGGSPEGGGGSPPLGPWLERLRIADDWLIQLEMVVRKPCRAAFTMRPLWLKRISGDNLYDGRDDLKVRRDLDVHDMRVMRDHLAAQLTALEHAQMTAHFGYTLVELSKWEFRSLQPVRSLHSLLRGLHHLGRGLAVSPPGVWRKLKELRFTPNRPPTPAQLDAEGITSLGDGLSTPTMQGAPG